MTSCKVAYEPQEDSTMLERHVRQYARGRVLDMGTGSGIQAITAALNSNVSSVLAADVQKEVIDYCKANIKNKKIRFLRSDLFENVKGKFDTILFNPPYLPQELEIRDVSLEGGQKGYEVIGRFLNEASKYLVKDGSILLVFSSFTKKEKVKEFIKNNLFEANELEKSHFFFEDIFVYLLKKSDLLNKFENAGIKSIKYFTKGHRGVLFTGEYQSKKIVIKAKNPQSNAFGRIENESRWLKILNKKGIGPRLLFSNEDFFVYEYIDGEFILDYAGKSSKAKIKILLKKVFSQMSMLDRLNVDKEEMHHPVKHVIVGKNKPFLVDFERAHYSGNPKNVTQFCQFVMSKNFAKILLDKKIKIDRNRLIKLAKVYKRNMGPSSLKKIMDAI